MLLDQFIKDIADSKRCQDYNHKQVVRRYLYAIRFAFYDYNHYNVRVQHVGAKAPLATVAQQFALAHPLGEHVWRTEQHQSQMKSRERAIVPEAHTRRNARIKVVEDWKSPCDVLRDNAEPADACGYPRIFVER